MNELIFALRADWGEAGAKDFLETVTEFSNLNDE